MSDNHTDGVLEDIQGKLLGLAEAMNLMHQDIKEMKPKVALIPQLATDIETIKAVQTDQGREIRHIETYLTSQGMPALA